MTFFFVLALAALTLLLLGLLIYAGNGVAFLIGGAPYVRANQAAVARMIERAIITPGDIVFDLGAGNGQLLLAAEKKGAQAEGFEISPWAYLACRIRLAQNHSRARVHFQSFLSADLSRAHILLCFLTPWGNRKVAAKLEKEILRGARLVSYAFPFMFQSAAITEQSYAVTGVKSRVYVYEKK